MLLKEFNYALPTELIAAHPLKNRPSARMMVLEKNAARLDHRIFSDLPSLLKKGDVLVLNNVKVFPARLLGVRATGGKAEAFLLNEDGGTWNVLLKPGGKIKKGARVIFSRGEKKIEAEVIDKPRKDCAERKIIFHHPSPMEVIWDIGHMPLPPYIRRPDEQHDRDDYQTVFASKNGAVAAPTAGLHFDLELLDRIRKLGVEVAEVTLYVGYGTFQPILCQNIEEHQMHEERYEISSHTADAINRAKQEGRRVIACGTTVVRTLESSAASGAGNIAAGPGKTRLFIYPPFPFRITDALITNFHLPESSLLILTAAFAGKDFIMRAYEEAVCLKYRFFSYGDCMFIS